MQRDVLHSHADNTTLTCATKNALTSFKTTVKQRGLNDPRSALMLYHIALLHQVLGKPHQAAAFIQKSYRIFETHFGGVNVSSPEAMRFLGGEIVRRPRRHLPSMDANATLVTVDITNEMQDYFSSEPSSDQKYVQALMTWECTPFPELPEYHFENIISMVFRSAQVEAFGKLIKKCLIRNEKVSTLTGLTGLLAEWKHNLGLPSGNHAAPAPLKEFVFGVGFPPMVSGKRVSLEGTHHEFLYEASEKLSELFAFVEHTANGAPSGNPVKNGRPSAISSDALSNKRHPSANDLTKMNGKEDVIDYYTPQAHTDMDKSHNAVNELADLVSSRLRSNRLLSLDELVDERQQKKLVRKLFNRNESRYKQFVQQINEISDWKTASEALESFYVQVGVSHYDKTALELSDMVYHRYFPAETDALSVNKFKW